MGTQKLDGTQIKPNMTTVPCTVMDIWAGQCFQIQGQTAEVKGHGHSKPGSCTIWA